MRRGEGRGREGRVERGGREEGEGGREVVHRVVEQSNFSEVRPKRRSRGEERRVEEGGGGRGEGRGEEEG